MTRWREVEANEAHVKEEARLLESEKENARHLKEEVLKRQALFDEMEVRGERVGEERKEDSAPFLI